MTQASPTEESWFYAHGGDRIGPISRGEIEQLITAGKVNGDTPVWSGAGDWQPARQSGLSSIFEAAHRTSPPPLTGRHVDNKFAWLIVAVPLAGTVIEIAIGRELIALYWILNIGLCVLDAGRLRAAGHKAPDSWTALLIPVYLWKRAALLKQRQVHFAAWMGAFVVSICMSIWAQNRNLEASACGLVTRIVKEQLQGTAQCKRVSLGEEVSDGFYKASALMDNGSEIPITIEQKGGQIFVKTLPQ